MLRSLLLDVKRTLKEAKKIFSKVGEPYTYLISSSDCIDKFGEPYTYSISASDCIDFEKLKSLGCDALEIFAGSNRTLYDLFYGWDCDSILILNKDVIIPV